MNPAWYATISRSGGRTWVTCTPDALLHPSAHEQMFRVGDWPVEYQCCSARRYPTPTSPLIMVGVGTDIPLLIPADHLIHLEVDG